MGRTTAVLQPHGEKITANIQMNLMTKTLICGLLMALVASAADTADPESAAEVIGENELQELPTEQDQPIRTLSLHGIRWNGKSQPDTELAEAVEWQYGWECEEGDDEWEPCDQYGKSKEGWECEVSKGVWEPCTPKKKKKKLPKKVAEKRYLTAKPTFYKHCNYGGYAVGLTRSTPWVVKNGLKNDDISSIKVPQGYSATIYEHLKYGGKKKTFGPGNFACLTQYKMNSKSWNDQISSIKIAKTKRRCGPTTRQFCRCGRVMKDGCATSHCKKCKPKIVHPKPKRYDGSRGRLHVRCPMGRALCRGRKTVKKSYMFH